MIWAGWEPPRFSFHILIVSVSFSRWFPSLSRRVIYHGADRRCHTGCSKKRNPISICSSPGPVRSLRVIESRLPLRCVLYVQFHLSALSYITWLKHQHLCMQHVRRISVYSLNCESDCQGPFYVRAGGHVPPNSLVVPLADSKASWKKVGLCGWSSYFFSLGERI